MIEDRGSTAPLSRKTRQQKKIFFNDFIAKHSHSQSSSCISKIINTSKYSFKGQIISIIFVLFAVVALFPKGSLSSPTPLQNDDGASTLRQEASLFPANQDLALPDSDDPSTFASHRMKRDAYEEDEDAMEDFNSWLDNGNGIEIGKRGPGNNRARRVSMMRLKKDLMRLQYPKRMSMMRLRRQGFFPVGDYNRATRGMGKVSMLRLKKGSPSYMRLKKMTQMRLKKMTQMRLKKSGNSQFSDIYDDDVARMASENKRDLEETAPVVIPNDQEEFY